MNWNGSAVLLFAEEHYLLTTLRYCILCNLSDVLVGYMPELEHCVMSSNQIKCKNYINVMSLLKNVLFMLLNNVNSFGSNFCQAIPTVNSWKVNGHPDTFQGM